MSNSAYRVDRKMVAGDWPVFVFVAIDLFFGAYEFSRMPAQMPIHWGVNGPNNFAPRWVSAFVIPLLILVLYIYSLYGPRFSEKMKRYAEVPAFYRLMRWGIALLLAVVHVVSIGAALQWKL